MNTNTLAAIDPMVTFAESVATEAEAVQAEQNAQAKRALAAQAIADVEQAEQLVQVKRAVAAQANASAKDAERIAHVKRKAADDAAIALLASETMVDSGLAGITVDDYEEEERKAKEEAHEKMSQRFMEYAARWKLISEQEAAAKTAAAAIEAAIEAAKPPLGVAAAKKAARKAQKKVDAKELALAREARFEQTKILCTQQAREYEMVKGQRNKL
jgi:hypothetical protein